MATGYENVWPGRLSPLALMMVDTDGKWGMPRHLKFINSELLKVAGGQTRRLLLAIPPRHGKSSLCSHYMPPWYLGSYPDHRILLASYGAEFASEWGRKARDVMERQCKKFGVEVRADSKAADAWMLKQGGSMHTTGIGGQLTGRGANLALVDDACKDMAQALSPIYQQRTYDWFTSTALTRLEPGASVCVIGTRWGINDLTGKLLEKDRLDGTNEWKLITTNRPPG